MLVRFQTLVTVRLSRVYFAVCVYMEAATIGAYICKAPLSVREKDNVAKGNSNRRSIVTSLAIIFSKRPSMSASNREITMVFPPYSRSFCVISSAGTYMLRTSLSQVSHIFLFSFAAF